MAKKDRTGETETEVQTEVQAEAKATEKQSKNKSKGKDKKKKPNIFVRFARKVKETFSELKRVTWPSFGKALKATGVVLVVVVIFMVLVTIVNYGFSELLELMTKWGN